MGYPGRVQDDGTVVFAADLAGAVGLHPGETLVAEHDAEGRLVLKTYAQVVREVQAEFRRLLPDNDRDLVAELIAERKAEARREDAASGL